MGELSILKLGGSLLTGKGKGARVRWEVVKEIARLLSSGDVRPLILVHGAGAIGHPLAKEYKLYEGYRSERHLEGFVRTSIEMRSLNNEIVRVLVESGLPSIGMPGGLIFRTWNGAIESVDLTPILAALDLDLVPVTCGDVVFDRSRKFTVLSGDAIAVDLARRLKAKRVVFATDVDGVFDRLGDGGTLIKELRKGEHLRPLYGEVDDVTGGMAYKIDEAFAAVDAGVDVRIVNGLHPERILKALRGEDVIGTRLLP